MTTIYFLPYLNTRKEIILDDMQFWPFWRLKSRRIRDESHLQFLEWYFKKWRDNIQYRRLDITIASFRGRPLGPYPSEDVEKLRTACAFLFLLAARYNNQLANLSSDNFLLFSQNFANGERRLALSAGSYINTMQVLSPGVAKSIKFFFPDYVPHCRQVHQPWLSDKKYYRAIQKAFIQRNNADWFVRLKRSLSPFDSSYSNVHSLGYFDRLLLIVTAIEVLLGIRKSSRDSFVKEIEATIGFANRVCRRDRSLAIINRNIRRFSSALYKKRSDYVHGAVMTQDDARDPRFGEYYKTSVILYYELVKSILEKNNLYRKRSVLKKCFEFNYGLFSALNEDQEETDR